MSSEATCLDVICTEDDFCCEAMESLERFGNGQGSVHPECEMWSFCPYCGDYC